MGKVPDAGLGRQAEPVHRPERERSVAPCKAGHPEIFHDQVADMALGLIWGFFPSIGSPQIRLQAADLVTARAPTSWCGSQEHPVCRGKARAVHSLSVSLFHSLPSLGLHVPFAWIGWITRHASREVGPGAQRSGAQLRLQAHMHRLLLWPGFDIGAWSLGVLGSGLWLDTIYCWRGRID